MNPYRLVKNDQVKKSVNISIHPNPSVDELIVEVNHSMEQVSHIHFYDESNHQIDLPYQIIESENRDKIYIQATLRDLKTGLYYIAVSDGKNITTSKFFKL